MIDAPIRTPSAIRQPGYIRTPDGASLFYRDWGSGRPLLFLSGWALNSSMWAYQMQPLAEEGLRCIAYDRRAHGRSSDPGSRWRTTQSCSSRSAYRRNARPPRSYQAMPPFTEMIWPVM